MVGVLYVLEHSLRLPPSGVFLAVEVGEVLGRVLSRITNVARLDSCRSSLDAVLGGTVITASVCRLHYLVVCRILKFGYTSLQKEKETLIHIYITKENIELGTSCKICKTFKLSSF